MGVLLVLPAHAATNLYSSTTGVGVGTSAPDQPLTVNGAVHSTTTGFELPSGAYINAISGNTATAATTTGSLTDGDLAVWDSHGNLTDGGDPSSIGALTLLATVNASGSSSVTFGSTYLTNTYNKYLVEFDGVYMNSLDRLDIEFSSNNCSTFISTGFTGGASGIGVGGTPTNYNPASVTGTAVGLEIDTANVGTVSTKPVFGTVTLSNPAASNYQSVGFNVIDTNAGEEFTGWGAIQSAASYNCISITPANQSTHTITGNFHLYGLSGT